MPARRARLVAVGDIQGVGFHYRVARLARQHGLTGAVRNRPDGQVEMVCEGEERAIAAYSDALRALSPPIRVEAIESKFLAPTGTYRGFRIVTGPLRDELVEGFGTGAALLDHLGTKMDAGFSQLGGKIDQLHSDFQTLDAKYDMTAEQLQAIHAALASLTDAVRGLLELWKSR